MKPTHAVLRLFLPQKIRKCTKCQTVIGWIANHLQIQPLLSLSLVYKQWLLMRTAYEDHCKI